MNKEYCINLCELLKHIYAKNITLDEYIAQCEKQLLIGHVSRIYIGSYFCSHYFLHLTMDDMEKAILFAEKKNIHVTLVLPVFTEKSLTKAKARIDGLRQYIGTTIDEVTVNDLGMLDYIHKAFSVSINLGRLMMKDYRDPRYPEYFNQEFKPRIFTRYMGTLIKDYGIKCMEFDPTHQTLDFSNKPESVEIGLHSPYCYMTTGQICEYSSIHEQMEKKFRPNMECKIECLSHHIEYELEEIENRKFIRFGRTIYFENKDCVVTGLSQMRVIFFPLDLYIG